MTDIIKTIEQDAVIVWDDFLKGITWLADEAKAIAAAAEKLDPGLQQQLQAILSAGEAAAAVLVSKGTGSLTNIVANLAADAESTISDGLSAAFGANPLAQPVSAATVSMIQTIGTDLETAIPVAIAKLVAAIAAAAK